MTTITKDEAAELIHERDHRLAPTSETSILGDALHDIRHQPDTIATLAWWMAVYNNLDSARDAGDLDRENLIYEAIYEGRFEPNA